MTYEEALAYVHSLLQFGMKPGLERMRLLMKQLGNPQDSLRYIHVAGTNGKGSVCTMLSEILQCAGYRTGLFTSPYVLDFRERMQLDGEMIPKEEFAAVMDRVRPVVDALAAHGEQPTEFEAITAAAFCWFAQRGCDLVVLETGLGGRLDSTNIIETPLLSVITSISMDHMAVLGDTIEQIASEKAGIIKEGGRTVCCPLLDARAFEVIRKTARQRGNAVVRPRMEDAKDIKMSLDATELTVRGVRFHIPLIGAHQIANTITAITAAGQLEDFGLRVSCEAIQKGIARARIPARMEVLSSSPLILLDGAHNEEGIERLAENLKSLLNGRRLTVVMGMMADKAYEQAVARIAPLCVRLIATTPDNPRALPAQELAGLAKRYCAACTAVESPVEAYRMARVSCAADGDALLVCGSLYLASDVRQAMLESVGKTNIS